MDISNGLTLGSNPASMIGNLSLEQTQQQNDSIGTQIADLLTTFASASVGTSNLQDNSVTNAKIANLTFETGQGNTLTLGGSENKNGILKVKDNSGNLISQDDNLGLHFYNTGGNEIVRLDSLGLHNYNTSGTVLAELLVTGLSIYGSANLNFQSTSSSPSAGIIGIDSSGNFLVSSDNSNQLQLFGTGTVLIISGGTITLDAPNGNININTGISNNINLNGRSFYISASASSVQIGDNGTSPIIMTNGHTKTAIIPTIQGYKALYCVESPEVWFFDFAKDKESIDPLFMQVTEGNMKTIKTEEGEIIIFRRRKGHGNKRFESKTLEQFNKNNDFWNVDKK